MRLIESRSLSDSGGKTLGQRTTLIQIEHPSDFDQLCANIAESGYYDSSYFGHISGYKPGRHVAHFWLVAAMLRLLRPTRALEVGCGRGDLLSLLARDGLEVHGVDASEDAVRMAWPELVGRLWLGNLADVCAAHANELKFDLLLGLDIWEHLHPAQLSTSIASATRLCTDDALAFCVVPAFGYDRSFGEQFPLEFEENRAAFERREPFTFLTAERTSPAVPASGHLIWAHAEWWEQQFVECGWRRVVDFDSLLHRVFDRFLPHSVRSFFLFARDNPSASNRVRSLSGQLTTRAVAIALAAGLASAVRDDPEEAARRWMIPLIPDNGRRMLRRAKRLLSPRRSAAPPSR